MEWRRQWFIVLKISFIRMLKYDTIWCAVWMLLLNYYYYFYYYDFFTYYSIWFPHSCNFAIESKILKFELRYVFKIAAKHRMDRWRWKRGRNRWNVNGRRHVGTENGCGSQISHTLSLFSFESRTKFKIKKKFQFSVFVDEIEQICEWSKER